MKLYRLLLYLPPELLDELADSMGIQVIENREAQARALVNHVKRGDLETEKELLQFIRTSTKPYELRGVISKAKLPQPEKENELFDIIHRNLEPVKRITAEDSEIDEERRARESIPEPEIQDDTVREEDTIEWRENAARKIGIYRSMEYTLGEAMADIIDNCISAQANTVWVQFTLDNHVGKRYVIIADDGNGMTEETLDRSMDIGADREYGERDLGKFGIGLKISSLSQAKEITVFSQRGKDGELCVRRISCDYIDEYNKFKLFKSRRKTDAVDMAIELLPFQGGTSVLWEEMDEEYINLRNAKARVDFDRECTRQYEFLSLVFHRYLSGATLNQRRIEIIFNGTPLVPIDPMMEDNEGEGINDTLVHTEEGTFEDKGEEHRIGLKWVILPHTSRIEKHLLERLKKVGDGLSNDQGVYLYRNDRLIKFGGWQGIPSAKGTPRVSEPHFSLAKLAMDVPPELDRSFRLSATKRHYMIPMGRFRDSLAYKLREPRHLWRDGLPHRKGRNISFLKKAKQRYDNESVKKTQVKPKKPKHKIVVDKKGEYVGIKDAAEAKTKVSRAVKDRRVEIVIEQGSVGGQKLIDSGPAGNTEKITINRNHPLYSKAVKKLKEELKDL